MSNLDYSIDLNFLALTEQEFKFTVYRKPCKELKPKKNSEWYQYSLPIKSGVSNNEPNTRAKYWISLVPEESFEPFYCHCQDNRYLSQYVLHKVLENRLISTALQYESLTKRFQRAVRFRLKEYPEGYEVISLEPYYLSVAERFGFLIEFEFKKREGIAFTGKIQRLSLSLDSDGKSNRNFYVDKYKKIASFINNYLASDNIFPIQGNLQCEINIERYLYQLSAKTLNPIIYIFGGDREGQDRLGGLRRFGPLEPLNAPAQFDFTFTDKSREYAVDLYKALRGELHPTTFKGMEKTFGTIIEKSNTQRSTLRSFTSNSINHTINKIKNSSESNSIQIAILPSRERKQEYCDLKYSSLEADLQMQIVTLDLLKKESTFKWAVSNIGLQIFAKLGGKPWKVKPSQQNCLIIGVGQAHQFKNIEEGRTTIDKYFAYSVLMDSSGIYKEIEILGDSTDKNTYLSQIQIKVEKIIKKYQNQFDKFVIHTPFKLKHQELEVIKSSLQVLNNSLELTDIEFVVIKINTVNKFFGYYSKSNSLVPYESTYLQLSHKEYLIWFEGIQLDKPNVSKRFASPTHVEFYFSNRNLSVIEKTLYLQDVINLAGANWRGFNAKLLPISIYYCQLIAKKIKEFNEQGYKNIPIETSRPWFL
ncbi:MAG: Piwi domain-containing protein [Xenococcaceae cyanobacterium]